MDLGHDARRMTVPRAAIATALWLAVHGCASVDGGAVELSWTLRPASSSLPDKFIGCDTRDRSNGPLRGSNGEPLPPVTRIRLDWEVGTRTGSESWRCSDNHGVTGFDLPEGDALLSVRPECTEGPAFPDTYTAPAAELRHVILGNTMSLGAVELVLQVSYCGAQPCICE